MRRSTPGRSRAQVGVDVECLPQPDQALLGTDGGALELRQADGAEEHGVRGQTGGQRRLRQRRSHLVDRAAAEGMLLELDVERERVEDLHRGRSDLRADAVSGQAGDAQGHNTGLKATLQAATEVVSAAAWKAVLERRTCTRQTTGLAVRSKAMPRLRAAAAGHRHRRRSRPGSVDPRRGPAS